MKKGLLFNFCDVCGMLQPFTINDGVKYCKICGSEYAAISDVYSKNIIERKHISIDSKEIEEILSYPL